MFKCEAWLRLVQKSAATCARRLKTPERALRSSLCATYSTGEKTKSPTDTTTHQYADGQKAIMGDSKMPDAGFGKKYYRWRYTYTICLSSLCGAVLWAVFELGQPEKDQFGRSIDDELSGLPLLQQYLQRMWHAMHYYQKMLEKPETKLLPDELCPPYIQPPYTLILEMRDVLVHPDWTYQTGWRFKKRPGVDHFLRQCSKNFEIIVFTTEQGMTAFPILDALDPNGYIIYRLVRSATQLLDGQHIKNLSHLNRNLQRVIVVDWDPRAVPLHPDNIFAISRWVGNDDDVQLFDLAAFLALIAEHKMEDVREVLHYYRQFEDPIEQFKENQRNLLEMKQEKPDTEGKLQCHPPAVLPFAKKVG